MKHLDLFSGIGGFALAASWVWGEKYENVGHCEIEEYACKVYHKHFPTSPHLGDITKVKWHEGQADIITGGFPCQDISVANSYGKGLSGSRSGLWSEYWRAIRTIRPRWVVIENSSNLIVRGLDKVLRDLSEIGYNAQWDCIPATYVGAYHSRDRIWIVSYPKRVGRSKGGTIKGRSGEQDSHDKSSYISDNAERMEKRWTAEPAVGRMAYGIPNRSHRIKGLGNAIVPQVAQVILQAIKEADECTT